MKYAESGRLLKGSFTHDVRLPDHLVLCEILDNLMIQIFCNMRWLAQAILS